MSMEVSKLAVCLDLMVEILKRLPVKYILRVRCVCKLWHSLTQEHRFINQHIGWWRNPPVLGIITLSLAPRKDDFSLHYLSSEGWQRFDMAGLDKAEFFCTSNSCNGLICLYSPTFVYVVNPSIREVHVLPKTQGSAVALALGHDGSTNEYKVVRLFKREGTSRRIECQIFTLGSPSWRAIEDAPLHVIYFSSPVMVNGAIHWGTEHGTENGIAVSFDIKYERFKMIMPPKFMLEFHLTEVAEMGGKLCLSVVNRQETLRRIIWILKDHEKCRWVRESFCLHGMHISGDEVLKALPIAIRRGRVIWSTGPGRVDCYDKQTDRFLKPMRINGTTAAVPFVESLVSPIAIQEKGLGCRLPKWAALKWKSRREWGRGLPCSEWVWDGQEWFKRGCNSDN